MRHSARPPARSLSVHSRLESVGWKLREVTTEPPPAAAGSLASATSAPSAHDQTVSRDVGSSAQAANRVPSPEKAMAV